MSPEQHQRIKRLFLAAVELGPGELEAFLTAACGGDGELRGEVESLLLNHRTETLLSGAAAHETVRLLGSALASTEQSGTGREARADADSARPAGTMIGGRYRLMALLGRGGMGVVYRAEDAELNQEIALKLLAPGLGHDVAAVDIVRREVRTARQITHPSVVRIFDFHVAGGEAFLTMEFVAGEDLGSLVRRVGPLPAAKVLQITRQLAAGLAAAHEAGVLHRDLKPANVMIDGSGNVRILDFGVAAPLSDERALRRVSGTPGFVAPEVLAGQAPSERSDLYGFGLVVYYAATGVLPDSRQLASEAELEARLFSAGMSRELATIVRCCLNAAPSHRPRSAHELVLALASEDPLKHVVSAGRIPSQALLAAASSWKASPRKLNALFVTGMVLIVLIILLADRTLFLSRCGLVKSPTALSEIAEEMLIRLGHRAPGEWVQTGVALDTDCLQFVRGQSKLPGVWKSLSAGEIPAVFFWYRQGDPRLPRPTLLGDSGAEDARNALPGSMTVHLDGRGKLMSLCVNESGALENGSSRQVDWPIVFDLADLNWPAFREVHATRVPPLFADEVRLWQGPFPATSGQDLHVMAAAHSGRLVYFEIEYPWQMRASDIPAEGTQQSSRFIAVRAALWLVAISLAAWLAWRHVQLGQADWQGTWRVSACVVSLAGLNWLCGSRHSFVATEELLAAFDWLTVIAFCGAMAAVTYLAVEPYARRWWPWSIITLRRLLDGRLTDGALWADVLLGVVVGVGAVWFRQLGSLMNQVAGIAVSGLNDFDPSQNLLDHFGLRYRIAVLVSALLLAVVQSLLALTLVVVCKRLLKSTSIAALVVILALSAFSILGRGLVSPIDWLDRVFLLSIAVGLLLRFGLVASIAALATYYAVSNAPITLDWLAWYAPTGFTIVLMLFAALVTSWRMARSRCPLAVSRSPVAAPN
jgi:hypothetical protein